MPETTTDHTASPIAELFGNLFGAILVGTIEDQTKK